LIKPQSFYRHYKEKPYRVLGIAHHSETQEELVLYEALYPNDLGPLWVRPRKMFEEKLADGVTERFRLDTQANQRHPVQRQLDAYNARDIETFLDCYTEDVLIEDATTGKPLMEGRGKMREQYTKMFASSPNLRCTVVKRMELNQTVIDEESIDGHPRGNGVKAIAIYHLRGDKIARVQFIM
jgi:hypothetical protein